MIDTDLKQRVKVCGIFFFTSLQSYDRNNVTSLFLPQNCGDKMYIN